MPRPSPHYTPEEESKPALQLLPTDTLPSIATLNHAFDPTKPLFATAQHPSLTERYGVVRNGTPLTAAQLRGEVEPTPLVEKPEAPKFVEAPSEVASPAPPSFLRVESAKTAEPEKKDPDEPVYDNAPPKGDPLDLTQLRERVTEGVFNSEEQRHLVESRLKGGEFDYADFLMDRPMRQTVVIIPGKLEITYEVLPYGVEHACKKLITEEVNGPYIDEYHMDRFHLYGLAASLYAINGRLIPHSCISEQREFVDPKALLARFDWLMRKPVQFVAMLSIQYVWFCARVSRFLEAVDPKGG